MKIQTGQAFAFSQDIMVALQAAVVFYQRVIFGINASYEIFLSLFADPNGKFFTGTTAHPQHNRD
jgi:hypothetical protein